VLLLTRLNVGRMVTGERWAVQRFCRQKWLTTGSCATPNFYLTWFVLRCGLEKKGKTRKVDRGMFWVMGTDSVVTKKSVIVCIE
jgi:hypothetical protein